MSDLLLHRVAKLLEEVDMEVVPLILPLVQLRDVGVDVPLVEDSTASLHLFYIFIESLYSQ